MMVSMENTPLNFDLFVEKNEDGLYTRVIDSPVGTAAALFRVPFSVKEFEAFARQASEPFQPGSTHAEALRGAALQLGSALYDATFAGDVGYIWNRSQNLAYEQRTRLRLRLQMSAAAELVRLPWEYLYNSVRREYVALSGHTPTSRFLDLLHTIRPLPVNQPLRMLVVIASPEGFPEVDTEREWVALLDTLETLGVERQLLVERLNRPTIFDLQRRLRQQTYHIVHFVAHGIYDGLAESGSIALEDEQQRVRLVSGAHLGAMLRDVYTVRLAVLHQCGPWQTARLDPFVAVAHDLVRRGLPAAVSVPFEMTDRATLAFAYEFYSRVVTGEPVDVAMADSRRIMLADAVGVEWGAPRLTMRTPDGRLFEPPAALLDAENSTPSRRSPLLTRLRADVI